MKVKSTKSTYTVRNDQGRVRLILGATLLDDGKMSFRHADAYYQLHAGLSGGVIPTKRKKGFSNYETLQRLSAMDLMEMRPSGPRGGMRYHTTTLGRQALELCRLHESSTNEE